MRSATLRPEVFCEQMPAPQRIAPYAAALSADVTIAETDAGTGRIILLHDPDGNDAWEGAFRCVAYCRCEIELDMVTDPLLADVGWTWLTDALTGHGATYTAASGTVTRVATESFGGMADDGGTAQIEIRASWTPVAAGRRDRPRHRSAHRGLGRAAVHRGRSRARARRRRGDAEPARAAGHRRLMTPAPDEARASGWTGRCRGGRRRGPRGAGRAARASRRPARGHRDRGRPGRGVCRPRGRHRARGDRRRACVRLPLLQPRLPDPAAPRGQRHRSGRPDRLRLRGPAPGRPRRHRVDPARGHPGPPLSDRASGSRRRACSTPSSPGDCSATRGSGWRRWSRPSSATA